MLAPYAVSQRFARANKLRRRDKGIKRRSGSKRSPAACYGHITPRCTMPARRAPIRRRALPTRLIPRPHAAPARAPPTLLHAPRHHRAAAGDGEHVLDGHLERLVHGAVGDRHVVVNRLHGAQRQGRTAGRARKAVWTVERKTFRPRPAPAWACMQVPAQTLIDTPHTPPPKKHQSLCSWVAAPPHRPAAPPPCHPPP